MPVKARIRRVLVILLLLLGVLLWLAALLLFTRIAENSDDFARLQNWILLVNSVGIAVLVALIAVNLVRLIRDLRRHVPGSRLKLKMIMLLVALAVTPLVVVYLFSVVFISRGIDNWFSVDVEQGLDNALTLSQTALDLQKRRSLEELERVASRLASARDSAIVAQLGELRLDSSATELTIFGPTNQIVATSSDDPVASVPAPPTEEINFQLRQGHPYVSLEPLPSGQYEVIAAVSLGRADAGGDARTLQAHFAVEPRLGTLANSVQQSYNQYAELSFLRSALKYSFTLTLSLVLLISVLVSVYGAFASSRRVVGPIQQLMQGTRAVARGDFDTRLPIPGRDEIGDAAPRRGASGGASQLAISRERAQEARGHPRKTLDGRRIARAGHAHPDGQRGRGNDSRGGPGDPHRRVAVRAQQGPSAARAVSRRERRASRARTRRMARAGRAARRGRTACAHVRMHASARGGGQRLRRRVR
jgi:nitrogen fixation/metabolism regulation signal transduction histidine kinase